MSETVKARNRNTMKEARSKAERIGFVHSACLECLMYQAGLRPGTNNHCSKCVDGIGIFRG